MNSISYFEKRLNEHFARLSSDRENGPVFLIEHGLNSGEVSDLLKDVGAHGGAVGFQSEQWRSFRLCLGVALTEFGYRYLGAGTEFWGFAERGLGAEIGLSERPEITSVFRQLSQEFDIAVPLKDRWSEAFGHIAWPIRNAMVSREIHSPLARLIRQALREKGGFRLDANFLSSLKELAIGMSSRRLEAWLSDDQLAFSVIRALAVGSAKELSIEQTFMQRLDEDLRKNRDVRRLSLAVSARRQASTLSLKSLPRPLYQLLIKDDEPIGLAIRGPSLNDDEQTRISALTGSESFDAMVTFGGRSLPFRAFTSGEAIFLGRPRVLPTPDVAGFSDISDVISHVTSPSEHLLFLDTGSDGYQPQIKPGERVSQDAAFLELRLSEADPDDWGASVFSRKANTVEGAARLLSSGVVFAQKELTEFFGGSTFARSGAELSQIEGHAIYVRATERPVEIEAVSLGGALLFSSVLQAGIWKHLDVGDEPCALHLTSGRGNQVLELTYKTSPNFEPIGFTVSPSDLFLNDVAAGLGSLGLKAPMKLDGAKVRLRLTDAKGHSVISEVTVDTLPAVIGFSGDGVKAIREAAQRWSFAGTSAVLQVEIEGLSSYNCNLPIRPREWVFDEVSGLWTTSGGRSVGGLVFDPAAALLVPAGSSGPEPRDFELLLPDIDEDQRLSSGLFRMNTSEIKLSELSLSHTVRILKNRDSDEGGEGLIAAMEALVAWESCSSTSTVSNSVRKKIGATVKDGIVEALCGKNWLNSEQKLRFANDGFHRRLVHFSLERKLAAGSDNFDPIDDKQMDVLGNYLLLEFEQLFPIPSLIVTPDGGEWPELDDAVNSAWAKLAKDVKDTDGITIDGDCGVFSGEWQKAVKDSREAEYLRPLARQILPIPRSMGLLQFSYLETSFDDLIAELNGLHTDVLRVGRHISPEAIRALLSLFLRPTQVLDDPDWRSQIVRFSSDRFSARAVRYAAVRYSALH